MHFKCKCLVRSKTSPWVFLFSSGFSFLRHYQIKEELAANESFPEHSSPPKVCANKEASTNMGFFLKKEPIGGFISNNQSFQGFTQMDRHPCQVLTQSCLAQWHADIPNSSLGDLTELQFPSYCPENQTFPKVGLRRSKVHLNPSPSIYAVTARDERKGLRDSDLLFYLPDPKIHPKRNATSPSRGQLDWEVHGTLGMVQVWHWVGDMRQATSPKGVPFGAWKAWTVSISVKSLSGTSPSTQSPQPSGSGPPPGSVHRTLCHMFWEVVALPGQLLPYGWLLWFLSFTISPKFLYIHPTSSLIKLLTWPFKRHSIWLSREALEWHWVPLGSLRGSESLSPSCPRAFLPSNTCKDSLCSVMSPVQ